MDEIKFNYFKILNSFHIVYVFVWPSKVDKLLFEIMSIFLEAFLLQFFYLFISNP